MRLPLPSRPVVQGVQRRRQKRAEQVVSSPHSSAQITANVCIWYSYLTAHYTLADGSCQINHVEPHFSPTNHTPPFKHLIYTLGLQ